MVFESIVVDILNKFLGDYVENLDRSQLKIGIWGGDVSLKNLSVKPSALDDLNLPVKTVYGHLGNLVLKIPWKNIYTAPVEVLVENLFLLVSPMQDVTYDAQKEEKLQQEAKQAMINKVEEAKKREKEKDNQQANDTFVEKLTAQIIKNVQIFIADIHVRYEDRITKPESPFSIGVSLHTLKIYTTNEGCESYVVPENESPLFYKIMVMEGLSVYWNTDPTCFTNAAEKYGKTINTLFVEGIASKTHRTVGYNYILGPINSDAKLQVNSKPELLNFITPKIFLSLVLEQLLLNLRKSQYQDLIALLEQFDRMAKASPFRKYRPDLRQYKEHYKEWWRFAISCALDDVKRKSRNWDWTCILHHRTLCKRYVVAYRRKLAEKANESLTKELELLERNLDAFNIVLMRQKVENEVAREGRINAEQQKVAKKSDGWFSGWFSSAGKTNQQDGEDQNIATKIVKQFGDAMNEEEKEKLYRAIDYHESLMPTLYPASFVAIRLEFVLKALKIVVIDDDEMGSGESDANRVMTVHFKEVHVSINQRPAAQSYAVSLTMQSFETLGTLQRGIVPKMIRSKLHTGHEVDDDIGAGAKEKRYFLNVFFETNPQDGQYDQRLHVTLRPLKVVYDAQTVIKILQVFTPQNDITTVKNQIQAAANTKFEEMKEKSAVKLQYAIEKSTKLDLKVDLMAPYLILPFGGFYTNNEMALVINLGRITVVSKSKDSATVNVKRMLKEGSSEDEVFTEMMSKCYDCFSICLGEVQILSLKAGQKWKPLMGDDNADNFNCDSHILQPTSVYVDIYKCVVEDDPRLPRMKIDGSLADVTVKITETTLLEMVSLIISLPLPSSSADRKTIAQLANNAVSNVDEDNDNYDDNDDDDVSTLYDSTASLRQKLESLNRLQFSTLRRYGKRKATTTRTAPTSNLIANVDYINLEANFSFKGLTVFVERDPTKTPLIEASVVTLQLSLVQRTYACEISAKLGKLSLLQTYGDSMIPAISTPVNDRRSSDQYLFFCKLLIADKNSPVFGQLYNSTAVKLAVEFTKLYVIVHQDAIMNTIQWIGDLHARVLDILSAAAAAENARVNVGLAANSASRSHSRYSDAKLAAKRRKSSVGSTTTAVEKKSRKLKTKSSLAAIVEDQLCDMTGSHSKAPAEWSDSAGPIIEFQVAACLDQVQLCLQTARRSLASMYVNGLKLSTRIDKSCTVIDATLHSINVCDPNTETIYNKVAYVVEGKQAFNAVVTLFNDHHTASDDACSENDFDISVKIQMSSLHCVFINEFLVDVLHFANNFQNSKKMLAEVSAAAVASAKMNVQQVYQSSTRVLLDIFVDAPVIWVPQNSRSNQVFIVDFGNLRVKNALKKLPNVSTTSLDSSSAHFQHVPLIEEVSVTLKDMQIIRTNYERTAVEHTLLKPVNYQLLIKRNLSVAWFNEVADFDIYGEFCPIHITITTHDYDVVMKTLQENFKAQAETRRSGAGAAAATVAVAVAPTSGQKDTRQQLRAFADEQTLTITTAAVLNEQDGICCADEHNVRTMVKFEMTIENVTIDLYTVVNDKKDGLAKFTLSLLAVSGSMLTDTRIAVHASLSNCCLDDTRSSKIDNPVKRYMRRKSLITAESPSDTRQIFATARNMIDVVFEKHANRTNLKTHVYSFVLILNVDHIIKIQEFFTPQSAVSEATAAPSARSAINLKKHDVASSQGSGGGGGGGGNGDELVKVTTLDGNETIVLFSLVLEKPDIILVENLDDIDTNAIILNNEADVKIEMSDGSSRLAINAVLRDLQLYTCCYNPEKRNQSASLIVHPLSIDVNGACSANGNLHLDVNVSRVNVSITADTIALLSNISSTLVPNVQDESSTGESSCADYSDVWNQKSLKKDGYWFLEMEEGEDALLAYADSDSRPPALPTGGNSSEKRVDTLALAVPVVRVTVEAGVGNKTIPLLALNSSFRATLKKTARHSTLDSFISLEIAYYNTRLAMWEPIIEPILQPRDNYSSREKYVPWKLQFQCKMLNKAPWQPQPPPQNDDEGTEVVEDTTLTSSSKIPTAEKEPLLSLHFNSDERIEITFTKTCMDVVKTLSQSFNDVVRDKSKASASASTSLHEIDGSSCYVLVNEFGADVKLSLADDQPFRLIDEPPNEQELHHESSSHIVVSQGRTVRLSKKKPVAAVAAAAHAAHDVLNDDGARRNTEERCLLDELNTITRRDTDFLRVIIVSRNKELALPVRRADKRYFMVKSKDGLGETWGLISEVDVVEGSVIVTIRSVLRIYNHFNVNMLVYSMKNDKPEPVGKVSPSHYLNVPVEAVYNSKGHLFFAPERYHVSPEPIVWRDLQKTVSFSKQARCISKNSENEDPFFMRILGEMEQVYYENTTCYTVASTAYSIRLRPTLIFKNFLPVQVVCCLQGIAVEHRLQPGQNINVCTAEPDHSTIVLRLDNYLDKVWSCKKLIKSDAPVFSVWTFTSFDSEKPFSLNLGVWYRNCDDSMIFTLYCPYWMVNKSGLDLSYKGVEDGGMILHHPARFEEPILFSFKEKSFFSKKKACVRVGDGEWSDKFSMDVAGNSGSVFCSYSTRVYQLGVYIRLNYNTLTKQVIFSPFFTLTNNCPFAVELRECRIQNAAWIRMESGACVPFWPIAKQDSDKLLELRVANTVQVTASFSYLKIKTHTLKLYNSYGGLQADVQVTEGGVYVAVAAFQPKMATALIINDTDSAFECAERDLKNNARDTNSGAENCDGEVVSLKSKHQLLFNWCTANSENAVLVTNVSNSNIDLRTDGVGELCKRGGIGGGDDEKIYWISFLNGMQRVLLITADPFVVKEIEAIADFEQTRQEIQLNLKGVGFSLVNNVSKQELLYVSVSSSTVAWQVQKQSGKRFKPANEQLNKQLEEAFVNYRDRAPSALGEQHDSMSLISSDQEIVIAKDSTITVNFDDGYIVKPSVKKIRRTYSSGLWLRIASSERYKQIHAKINRIQIDNQIYDCVFPVIFSPVPPPKSVADTNVNDENSIFAREKPFAELSIVQRVDENAAGAVKQFKYFKILVQEFHVKVDIGFVYALLKFLEADRVTDDEELNQFRTDQHVYKEPLGVHISSVTSQDFYDLLHFSPLKIHVSFSLCGENANDGTPQQGLPIVNLLTQSVGVTLTDVNDVVFRLAYFERKHTFYSQSQLMTEAKTHYIGQFVKQLYVLVLGLDVLGNPFGLVTGLKQGVEDFFYEPFQGAIQGPSEFAEGVFLGVRSLFGHTVGGAAGAVGRITGAMGKGIAALTLDEEYQKKRRQRLAQQHTSFAEGSRGLVMGVYEGVGGVISKPISGAKEEGVEGFVKGVGKGLVGLFMRPASGVVDFASGTVDVVRRVASFSEEIGRYRLPRYFKENGLIIPYSQKDALGIKLLLNTEKGKFISTDEYVFHLPMSDSNQPDKEVLLVTNNRVIYLVKSSDIFSDNIKIEWQYTWNEIKEDGIAESEYGVSIRVDANDCRRPASSPVSAIGSLFKRTTKGKILIVSDKELRMWLIAKMRELAKKAHRSF